MTTNPHTFTRRAALDPADELVTHDSGPKGTFSENNPNRYRVDTRFNSVDPVAQPSLSGLNVVGVAGGGSRIAAFVSPFVGEAEADDPALNRRSVLLLRPAGRGMGRARC